MLHPGHEPELDVDVAHRREDVCLRRLVCRARAPLAIAPAIACLDLLDGG